MKDEIERLRAKWVPTPAPDEPFTVAEIRHSIASMRARIADGQGLLSSAMCRLSLPMSDFLLTEYEEAQRQVEAIKVLVPHSEDCPALECCLCGEHEEDGCIGSGNHGREPYKCSCDRDERIAKTLGADQPAQEGVVAAFVPGLGDSNGR